MAQGNLNITVRPTAQHDLAAIDDLLRASYPRLLRPDYPPSVLVTVLPLISRANPALLRSGTYFLVEDDDGRLQAAGGWTPNPPQGGVGPRRIGHIRQVATHPDAVRRGCATAILEHTLAQAMAAGVETMMCQSTRTAVPLYRKLGFRVHGDILITLRPGITFPAVEMSRAL